MKMTQVCVCMCGNNKLFGNVEQGTDNVEQFAEPLCPPHSHGILANLLAPAISRKECRAFFKMSCISSKMVATNHMWLLNT